MIQDSESLSHYFDLSGKHTGESDVDFYRRRAAELRAGAAAAVNLDQPVVSSTHQSDLPVNVQEELADFTKFFEQTMIALDQAGIFTAHDDWRASLKLIKPAPTTDKRQG